MDVQRLQRQEGLREGSQGHELGEYTRMTPTRRLAAILAADVAGYSRLMGADEVGTRTPC